MSTDADADADADADEQALLAAMGFSHFGAAERPRKRTRRAPPSPPPLVQLSPGTELAADLPADFPRSRVASGPFGVLFLAHERPLERAVLLQALSDAPHDGRDVESATQAPAAREQRSAALLARLRRAKTRFSALDAAQFRAARSACNAFERLGRHRFLNRSAMKLAALDHVFQWTARWAAEAEGKFASAFAFADICGGPGGFSEYLLWRLQHRGAARRTRGFGITLRGAADRCDWRLPPSLARVDISPETEMETKTKNEMKTESGETASFTICYGADGTGDVYAVANVRRFCDVVRARCPSGVALAVADGGFQDARDCENQEALMTRLVAAEVLAALAVLQPGGDLACKTFELATPAMRQLVWLLHQCFAELAVVKPVTSRPASSERYIVARGLHRDLPLIDIIERLESCVADDRVHALLPNPAPFQADVVFHEFMAVASDRFAAAQIAACDRIMEYVKATPKRQAAMRDEQRNLVRPTEYYACWELDDTAAPDCYKLPSNCLKMSLAPSTE